MLGPFCGPKRRVIVNILSWPTECLSSKPIQSIHNQRSSAIQIFIIPMPSSPSLVSDFTPPLPSRLQISNSTATRIPEISTDYKISGVSMDGNVRPCPSPCPQPPPSSSSSLLKDVSNFKTPKSPSQFLISPPHLLPRPPPPPLPPDSSLPPRKTPRSAACFSFRGRPTLSGPTKTKAAGSKAFELEQSQSSRKEQIKKEQALRSLSKSLTT